MLMSRIGLCLLATIACNGAYAQVNFWQQMIGSYDVRSLARNSNDHIFAGTVGNGVLRSTDNGADWAPVNSGLGDPNVWALAINSTGHIFAGTSGGVFRSTNNGANWILANSGLTEPFVRALVINPGGHIFAGTNVGGFRSTDDGANWTIVGPTAQVYSVVINFNGPPAFIGHIFAGTEGSGIFRSTDNGANWTAVNTGLTRWYVPALAINSGGHIFGGTTAGSDAGVVRSTNNGGDWVPVLSGLHISSLVVNSPAHIFAGTPFAGVFRSTNNGATWDSVNSGLTNLSVWALSIISTGYIFAGTGSGGVFRSVQSTTFVQEPSGQLPTSFVLEQNYPNPFNPSTTIGFSLPRSGHVTLRAFNLVGEEVATLLSQEVSAGTHETKWDVSGISSGIYFYRLQAGSYSQTRKLLLLR